MQELASRRCRHHFNRAAVARCPGCSEYFCRECVTEHEDRVLCVNCLQRLHHAESSTRHSWRWLVRLLGCAVSVTFLWLVWYGVGQMLLALPDTFHDGLLGQKQEMRP